MQSSRVSVKLLYRILTLFAFFLTGTATVKAQCDQEIFLTNQSPWILCSSQMVTVTIETYYNGQNGMQWGQLRFYRQETGGQPFATKDISVYSYDAYTDVDIMAEHNNSVWVSFYNSWYSCESPRIECPLYFGQTPGITTTNDSYTYACGSTGNIKMSSSSAANWYLYKDNGSGGRDQLQTNTTGTFTIANYDPNGAYSLYLISPDGCSDNNYTRLWFDYFSAASLTVNGNKNITAGSSTTLSATGPDFYTSIKWFDASGNLLYPNDPFTTPVLTANTTYQVRGYNDNNNAQATCVTPPTSVTVQVTTPVVCNRDITFSQPYMCSPQTLTLTAKVANDYLGANGYMNGTMRFYSQASGGQPIDSKDIHSNADTVTATTEMFVNWNTTIWVSYYDTRTQCESPRVAYTYVFSPTPTVSWDYAYVCGTTAKVQMTSTLPDVTFYLLKANSSGARDVVQFNTTGYFEMTGFDVNGTYYAQAVPASGCGSGVPTIYFDVYSASPPIVTGNTTLLSGTSTTLKAYADVYNFKWYDEKGNLLYDGADYTTPLLTDNVYTYQVRAYSNDERCASSPATVVVTVNLPTTAYSTPYNSSNFTKTIDLSKPVGAIDGSPGTSPTGAATYTIPIYTPPGTNGVVPSVNLSYSSQAGNGIAGYGWNIDGLSAIGRTGKSIYHNGTVTPVTLTDQDAFTLDGSRLNAINGANGANGTVYASEVEGFATIVSKNGTAANPEWFEVTNKDGSVMEYGNSTDSRILSDDGASVILWRLSKVKDANGNYVQFKYDNGYRDSRIDEINYTGNDNAGLVPYNKIRFNYEVRSDVATTYVAGASFNSKHILKSIAITSEGSAVKTYQFNYGYDNLYSLLNEVVESGTNGSSLNSTTFLYGEQTHDMEMESTDALVGAYDFFAGDFDADGKTDLLAATLKWNNGVKYHLKYELFKDVYPTSATYLYAKDLADGNLVNGDSKKFNNFLTSDYDGDGRDDVMQLTTANSDSKRVLQNVIVNYTKSHNSSTGYTDHIETSYPIPAVGSTYNFISDNGNYFIPGDFDGNGNQDYILVLGRPKTSGDPQDYGNYLYKAFLNSPSTGIVNQEITNFGVGANPYPAYFATTVANANIVTAIDLDGDGKQEVMVSNISGTSILSLQQNGSGYTASSVTGGVGIYKDYLVYPGDFNGDSKTDLLVRPANGNWKILLSTGKSYIETYYTFSKTPTITGAIDDDKIVVSDFNGDGKSDILHGYRVSNTATSVFALYYSKGTSAPSFQYEQYPYNNTLAASDGEGFVVADFNGDGRSDLLNKNYSLGSADFIRFNPLSKERMLTKVTDGHNVTHSFDYKLLTDEDTYPYFYTRTVSLDDPNNSNYFNYVQMPFYAVSSLSSPNGVGGVNTTNFTYENAVLHRGGKGFLGFNKITANNLTSGVTTITQSAINRDFAVPYPTWETAELTTGGDLLSLTNTTISFMPLSTGANDPKRFTQRVDKVFKVDYLTGAAVETNNVYDAYGNVTSSESKTGSSTGSSVNEIEKVTTTTTFGIHGTPVKAKPDEVIVTRTRNGASSSTTTKYNYSGALVTDQNEFFGLAKEVKSSYTYDALGNVLTTTVTSKDGVSRTTSMEYEAKGRFVITKKLAPGTSLEQKETYIYNGKWGKPLSSTSSSCITTSYDYDAFGRPTTTIDPLFTAHHSLAWDVLGNNLYYSFTDYTGGKPDSKVWFDVLGRETKKEIAGFNNQSLVSGITYDAKGNVASSTNEHYSNETPIITSTTYDAYNRPQTVSNSLNTVNYTYTASPGSLLVTSTDQAGQTTTKTTDAAGRVVASSDKGGSLSFSYDSRGLKTEVKHGSNVMVTSAYDDYGRQTSMVDKNAGTVTYVYDGLGQLITQTDANGNTYQSTYDNLGRIISRQGSEGTYTYEYYKNTSTGCTSNSIKRTIGYNGVEKLYDYDNLMRTVSETVTIDGVQYQTQYTYDAYGNVNKITYPSGVEVHNTYDNNGRLYQVTGGDAGSQTTLFNGTAVNGYGQFTDYTLANNRSTQASYENGFPTHYYTQGIQDLNYTWDYTRKNLLSREEIGKGLKETFQYDDLNRLKKSTLNNVDQIAINYDGSTTFSMGNIASKTDAGDYTYKTDKVHAVAYITNPTAISNSLTGQAVTYTPFLKVATISENDQLLTFKYGPDYERVKSVLQPTNLSWTESKIYLGAYEKFTDRQGATKEIHYVYGGNGLCAMIVKENGSNNTYATYTDHLGSILTLTDLNGNKVEEQNFDAWGRNRNPQDWTFNAVPATTHNWLYRGYTGHEHLPQFALINMNGRLYDPIQGRMISPDNFIANELHTQAYNRYSYANNNPLVYTDPDGNNPFLVLFAIGNVIAHGQRGENITFKRGLNYFAQGLATGSIAAPFMMIYAPVYLGATEVAAGAAVYRGLLGRNHDWKNLDRVGQLFVGNFYLDENRNFSAGMWQGISRFTWESKQQSIGYAYSLFRNATGAVDRVMYYGGATFAVRDHMPQGTGHGVTIGNFININTENSPTDVTKESMFMHEYGHTLQSQYWGALYPYAVMVFSGLSATFSSADKHNHRWYEMQANRYAWRYFDVPVWNTSENPRNKGE